jgi:hypothetical protein
MDAEAPSFAPHRRLGACVSICSGRLNSNTLRCRPICVRSIRIDAVHNPAEIVASVLVEENAAHNIDCESSQWRMWTTTSPQ